MKLQKIGNSDFLVILPPPSSPIHFVKAVPICVSIAWGHWDCGRSSQSELAGRGEWALVRVWARACAVRLPPTGACLKSRAG